MINRIPLKNGTMIYPLPAVMVSCGANEDEYNILTIAWTGTICSDPPMCYISVRKSRYSYEIIKRNMQFVINLTNKNLVYATDWCGVKSGRNVKKFTEMKLTAQKALVVNAPLIAESPLCIECEVKQIIQLGSHDMFIAQVVAVSADEQYLNAETGEFELEKAKLIAYSHGAYYHVVDKIGKFGFSVEKKVKTKERWKK